MERLDAFMARANAAYYADHDPFADFTTAPEISQAFGEVLGLWAAVAWRSLGAPDPVALVEAGPGRATLMTDALRAIARAAPDFRAALRLHLIETSPRLRAVQAQRLSDAGGTDAVWHDAAATLQDLPLIMLANEFLDALPIRQFIRRGTNLTERFVADGQFVEVPTDVPAPDVPEGAVIERGDAARAFVGDIARRLARHPGTALFLDYGPTDSAPGDSLQALSDGKPTDPLAAPGAADLTAHVDFAALAAAAREAGAIAQGPLPQGVFLTRLGLVQRTGVLARSQPPARAAALVDSARRLVEPDRMGRLFKVLALGSPGCPALPGFEA
jgi:SAM-dependent MidA family methyltransferase